MLTDENQTVIVPQTKILEKLLNKNIEIKGYTERIFHKIKVFETLNAILSFIVIMSSMFEYELEYFPKYYKSKFESK